jgi:predicted peptidase
MLILVNTALCAESAKTDNKASAAVAKGFQMKTIPVDDKEIKYVVYIPPVYDAKKAIPAIVFLNGMGECGSDGLKQVGQGIGTAVLFGVEKWPFIIIFPQKQDTYANWEDEDDMVMAILEKTRKEYDIDNSRIYLTGISQGGHGTWTIGAKHADLFAAIAPICGWGDEEIAKKLTKMPIWAFHGDADDAVSVESSRKMSEYLKTSGGSCKLTIYPGVGHNSWDKAYREEKLGEWFLEHKK